MEEDNKFYFGHDRIGTSVNWASFLLDEENEKGFIIESSSAITLDEKSVFTKEQWEMIMQYCKNKKENNYGRTKNDTRTSIEQHYTNRAKAD